MTSNHAYPVDPAIPGPDTAELILLAVIAAICVLMNYGKAFHIDDGGHLDIATAIVENPLRPMSSEANWTGISEPIHEQNQPHLFFYLMAGTIALFGPEEAALHTLAALFSIAAALLFYLLARRISQRHAIALTAAFVLGPAFLPAQNVMVDVPMTTLWLAVFWCLFKSRYKPALWWPLCGLFVAAACLTKYTSLVLLPLCAIIGFHRKEKHSFWSIIIPAVALSAWSLWNLWDYGSIHLLDRQPGEASLTSYVERTADWVLAIGCAAPFATFLFIAVCNGKPRRLLASAALGAACVAIVSMYFRHHASHGNALLTGLFYGNGLMALILGCYVLITERKNCRFPDCSMRETDLILTLWLAGAAAFSILFAPFMAIRHVLPAIPPLLLLAARSLPQTGNNRLFNAGIVVTVLIGMFLGVSDRLFAEVYRQAAPVLQRFEPVNGRLWFAGHWGWQWYASKEGMRQYDMAGTVFKKGDRIIVPAVANHQFTEEHYPGLFHKIGSIDVPAPWPCHVRTMGKDPGGGYYSFSFSRGVPPVQWSAKPLETFTILEAVPSENNP